jgi:hypothetical protein
MSEESTTHLAVTANEWVHQLHIEWKGRNAMEMILNVSLGWMLDTLLLRKFMPWSDLDASQE